MFRAAARRSGPLAREWVRSPDAVAGAELRVMHFNVLADCLARSAPLFGTKRGFRCGPEALSWEHRSELLRQEMTRHGCDIVSLCEVDRYDDFFEPELARHGYGGTFKRKRSPAKDGVAVFWRRSRWEDGLQRAVYLERGGRRTPAQQVALLQRLRLAPSRCQDGGSAARSVVVCATHLRSKADEALRMQQASEVVSALADFSRGDERIIMADINSDAPSDSGIGGSASSIFEYFQACGYRCAYRAVGAASNRSARGGDSSRFPDYTTWAGWASGDFRAVCDHIFVSSGIHVSAVLDVPPADALAAAFPERLPNDAFPSDHMSLVADLVIP